MIELAEPKWRLDYAQHSISLPSDADGNENIKQAHKLCEDVSTSAVDDKRNSLFPCKYYINKNAFPALKAKLLKLLGDPLV